MLSRIGPVTADVARALAVTAAADAACEWRLIVVGRAGNALAVTSVPRTWFARPCHPDSASAVPGPRPRDAGAAVTGPSMIARVTLTVPLAALPLASLSPATGPDTPRDRLTGPGPAGWTCAPELRPPLAAAQRAGSRAAGRVLAARAAASAPAAPSGPRGCGSRDEGAAGHCAHEVAVTGYRVPSTMRTLIEARDLTCRFPGCRQPAWRCDQDHTIAYERGGRTCPCNLGSACRHHHRLKQLPDWLLIQPRPGVLTWRTPARLTYTVVPETHVA
jgi:hypothetical protein